MDNKMDSKLNYCLDPEKLTNFAKDNCEAYAQAEPFPHIIMDNFFPEDILDNILNEFPKSDEIDWQKFEAAPEKKLASKSEIQMGEYTRFFLYKLNSSTFLNFLETLTGID
ncbi:MAG: 2OG-Fe(II) oxygenase, partial [Moorea sp. SIO4A1]|nr:2OG-Fe(II) oxygenase [Moorena sp. SIO4A1]